MENREMQSNPSARQRNGWMWIGSIVSNLLGVLPGVRNRGLSLIRMGAYARLQWVLPRKAGWA